MVNGPLKEPAGANNFQGRVAAEPLKTWVSRPGKPLKPHEKFSRIKEYKDKVYLFLSIN